MFGCIGATHYCTRSTSVGTFCFKYGSLNTKPVTISGPGTQWHHLLSCFRITNAGYLCHCPLVETTITQLAEKLSLSWFPHFENCRLYLALVSVFFPPPAAAVCTNRITRGPVQPCFRYSWYHIATACQLFYNEVEAWFWWLMWQWGKVGERWEREVSFSVELWKWLRCNFRFGSAMLIMRIICHCWATAAQ